MNKQTLNTLTFSGDLLLKMKAEKNTLSESLCALKKKADVFLCEESLVVTKRNTRAITGNPHDYASVGPYWWPNPDTPDGLPYIRRDGEIIPGAIEEITPRLMADRVFELTLAAFYFDDEKYGRAAEKALYDWHLNPETYMTPHAEYAQAIPGICTGRGIGIIDFAYSYRIFDAVAILEYLGYIKEEVVLGLKKWYSEFCDWMLTSENGLDEDTELNNHGTFFDAQILAIAKFTGREALAKKICKTVYDRRVKSQIEPDGKQPLELARTMAIHYSLVNIRGFIIISNIAETYGYTDLSETDKNRGNCILKSAIDYIYPYILDPDSFPYQELWNPDVYPTMQDLMSIGLCWAEAYFKGEGYLQRADALMDRDSLYRLKPHSQKA